MLLSHKNLSELSKTVAIPNYDRTLVTPSILHIGVGNFHRAHQAVYLNDLLNTGQNPMWGLRGAGVCQPDAVMRGQLSQQDWLYTVVEVESDRLSASVVGSMIDFLLVQPQGNLSLIQAMTDPTTKIVSLTITEGGYFIDSATGTFDITHPAVALDIAHSGAANTVFGAIVAALAARKSQGLQPFTVMSCDNLPGNGDITAHAVTSMAHAIDPALGKWIRDTVSFPNSMIDRITPVTGSRERQLLSEAFDIDDQAPVFCEPFRQWVVEDKFVNGRPEFEASGMTLTDNIHDFEKMKIRILNGGHAILAYASALLGITYTHDAMANPLIKSFLRRVLHQEVLCFVPNVQGFTPEEYLDLICARFENKGIADTIQRLCFDGSNRQPKFIIPSIKDNLAVGKTPRGLALCSALWCCYCNGNSDQGEAFSNNDPNWNNLQATARRAQSQPSIWLEQSNIYGTIGHNKQFVDSFTQSMKSLSENKVEHTLRMFLSTTDNSELVHS